MEHLQRLMQNVKTLIDCNVLSDLPLPLDLSLNRNKKSFNQTSNIKINKPRRTTISSKKNSSAKMSKVIQLRGSTILQPESRESWDQKLSGMYKIFDKMSDLFHIGN